MAEGTSAASDLRRVAVMFVDFRSFTAGAQSRTPQEVVDRLDGAFAVLVDILDRHGGIVNKFLGDGFLALFGAPLEASDAAHRAVAAGARHADRDGAHQRGRRAGRCGSASASISARWSPAISARPGARNIP